MRISVYGRSARFETVPELDLVSALPQSHCVVKLQAQDVLGSQGTPMDEEHRDQQVPQGIVGPGYPTVFLLELAGVEGLQCFPVSLERSWISFTLGSPRLRLLLA